MLKPKLQFPSIFASKTPISKQTLKNLQSVLFSLQNHPDSEEFREPLEFKQRGLINYEHIVQTPMDISTVRKMLNSKIFKYVEDCLDFTQTIFENSLLYNQKTEWIVKLTKKCELVFHKLVKNHLPQVVFKREMEGKKMQKKTKQFEKGLQKINADLTDVDSEVPQPNQLESRGKSIQKQHSSKKQLEKSKAQTEDARDSNLFNILFSLIYEASEKSLEVLYIMTKNENIGAISTDRNGTYKIKVGNCAIDVEKLNSKFIAKSTTFLKNEAERTKNQETKEKKNKPKFQVPLNRFEI